MGHDLRERNIDLTTQTNPPMTRPTIARALAVVILTGGLYAAEDAPTEFKLRPIGHVEKSEDRTLIVLNEQHKPGLLGLEGNSRGRR